jgi:hypothetical protein
VTIINRRGWWRVVDHMKTKLILVFSIIRQGGYYLSSLSILDAFSDDSKAARGMETGGRKQLGSKGWLYNLSGWAVAEPLQTSPHRKTVQLYTTILYG